MSGSSIDEQRAPHDPRSVTEQVADELRERIKYGRLAPGQRLVEADLIQQLHVSRGTVRAAFSQLASEGIITIERNRGAHVRVLDLEGVRQLYELRAILEGRAAGLTAERIDQPGCRVEMRRLSKLNDKFEQGGNSFADYWNYNERLHGLVMEYSGNGMLRRMAEQARTLTYHYHLQAATQSGPTRPVSISHACAQHHEILERILVGDADGAEASMREHILDNGAGIIASMREAGQASRALLAVAARRRSSAS